MILPPFRSPYWKNFRVAAEIFFTGMVSVLIAPFVGVESSLVMWSFVFLVLIGGVGIIASEIIAMIDDYRIMEEEENGDD